MANAQNTSLTQLKVVPVSPTSNGEGGRFSEGPFVLGTLSGVAYLSVCGGWGTCLGEAYVLPAIN